MLPQSLSFLRSQAGKPALAWDGEAGSVDGRGAHLQFNLSHTGSLLGADHTHACPAVHCFELPFPANTPQHGPADATCQGYVTMD